MTDSTPIYNLKAVIQETGLGPETLRAWERRYGLVKPQRSPGGHRLYSQYDIDMLKWLVARQKEGLSISRAVEMWRGLVKDGQDPLQQFHTPLKTLDTGGSMLDDLRNGWIAACLAFDEQAAERALSQAFAIVAPEIACTEVLVPERDQRPAGAFCLVISHAQDQRPFYCCTAAYPSGADTGGVPAW
jgi:DNA-binding transcriptional MerR regulator